MATIKTSIMVHDMMSQQFRAMNMAMATVIDSFQTLQDLSGKAVDVSALEAAQRELQQVEANFNQIEQEIKQAENAQESFNRDLNQADNFAKKLLGTLGGIAGTYFTLQGVKQSISLSDEMANTTARLNLINDGLLTTAELQQQIFESAQRTFTPYQDTADMVGKLGMQARAAFADNAEIVAFAEQINKTFKIAGTHAQGVESVMLQLTQAMAAGTLQGEELNAILDNAQPIVANIQRYLEEAMNIDASNIKKLASEGVITAEIIKNAMFYAAEETNKAFESIPLTWSDLFNTFQNDALKAFEPVLQEINNIANSERVQEFVSKATQALFVLADVALWTIQVLSSIGSFVYDHWNIIGPIILGVAGAFGVLTAALIGTRVATLLMTAAQWALNAAMAMNPIFWIIAALVLLIGLYFAAVNAINYFTGANISATGIIAGAFMLLYAVIYNIIANLWNVFAAIAEFFVNVWQHPMYSVKRLFYNLATNVIDNIIAMTRGWDGFATSFANAIISGINIAIRAWNEFINLLPDAITSFLGLSVGTEIDHRKSITSDLERLKGLLGDWVGDAPEDYWTAPRMEHMNYSEAWNTGYNWGKNLFSGFDLDIQNQERFNMEKYMKDILNSVNGLGDAIDAGNGSAKDTAGNTGKLADSVDLLEEDMKYLRDAANAEAINRYTTGNITIDMSGMQNNINSELDLDGIVDKLVAKTEEALDALPEGV